MRDGSEEDVQVEVMRQRIALAKATGKDELARRLEAELAELAGPL